MFSMHPQRHTNHLVQVSTYCWFSSTKNFKLPNVRHWQQGEEVVWKLLCNCEWMVWVGKRALKVADLACSGSRAMIGFGWAACLRNLDCCWPFHILHDTSYNPVVSFGKLLFTSRNQGLYTFRISDLEIDNGTVKSCTSRHNMAFCYLSIGTNSNVVQYTNWLVSPSYSWDSHGHWTTLRLLTWLWKNLS